MLALFRMIFLYTVKPVNKSHPRERQNKVLIDKRSLFAGYIVLFYQERVIEVWCLLTGLYSEVTVNAGLTVFVHRHGNITVCTLHKLIS